MQKSCMSWGMHTSPLARAIEAAGGPAEFTKAVGISPRTLASWKKEGVPDTRWREVVAACRGAVSAEQLAIERVQKGPARVAQPEAA